MMLLWPWAEILKFISFMIPFSIDWSIKKGLEK